MSIRQPADRRFRTGGLLGGIGAVMAGAILIGGNIALAQEPAEEPVLSSLTFTEAQATQGESVYGTSCGRCHAGDLGGLEGPPLKGSYFMSRWSDRPVFDLFDRTMTTMPQDNPGALSDGQYVALLAYMASANGLVAGDTPMPSEPEALQAMGFAQDEAEAD